ncbi:DUF86 domain-containing protein [Paenisporosarcina sp. TG-14]|uniref:DUF86 domain-containing protein n=1 Tax=Paenisporosarcina sp. TG-14 TaxID=1231057 RepID=UPI0002D82895|nr:DUF86 domain-containing protein [Paenisporosarcina sp. TG-14]
MYFVDRKNISLTLSYMKSIVQLVDKSPDLTSNDIDKLALERITQNIIESIIDVGNSMIDGFIMRDPGSYDDIIDILTDEKVITPEMDAPLKEVILLRKMLVRDFISVNHQELAKTLQANIQILRQFPNSIEHYLTHELGPVSAFLPEEQA